METTLDSNAQKFTPMSVGDWIITYLILLIPLVNIILLFVWAFGDGPNITRKNWAKGYLMLIGIMIVFWIFISIIMGMFGMFNA